MRNVHERLIPAPAEQIGKLIDSLASSDDRLWPKGRWPSMRFDRGLVVGARGGHGPIRYEVVEHVPGERVAFRFTMRGIRGGHRFEVWEAPASGGTLLRHVAEGRTREWALLGWPLAIRWLHDALLRDALDRAEAHARGEEWRPRPLGPWVRLMRKLISGRSRASGRPSAARAPSASAAGRPL